MNNMDIEDNYSQQKLYERLEKNRERFRSRDLTKRRKKRHATTASTRKRNLKHSQLMSRRSQPQLVKKQRNKKQPKMEEVAKEPERKSRRAKTQTAKFDPIKEEERQKQLKLNVKENEAKNAASKLVQSFGYSGKNVPVKILDTDLFNKALTQAIQDDLFGESNYKEAYSSDENMGMGKGRKSKRRRGHRGSKKK
jgi:hypothetical protein